MAVTTALSWAVLAIGLKLALHTFSSGTIVWMRLVFAFALLLTAFSWKRREWLEILRRPPLAGLACGLLISFNYFGFMKGIELTSASNAQILIQLAPFGFAVSSIFLFRELPTKLQVFGMALALTGFGFFFWDQMLVSWDHLDSFKAGNLWVLGAAASWIVFALLQKKLLKTYQPQQFNLLIYGVSAIALLPTATLSEVHGVSALNWLLILFLALNTVVAYGALSEALARIPASQVSMIIAVNPLLTLAIMTYLTRMNVGWISGEPIGWRGLVGAILVVLGVISTVTTPPRFTAARGSPKL